jgi:hypothetical protein
MGEVIAVPWQHKTSRAEKGVAHLPMQSAGQDVKAREALLSAIGKALRWLKDITDGSAITEIAQRDGRSERQIRILLNLAFLSPGQVKAILDGTGPIDTITNTARQVPMIWPEAA